MIDFEVSDLELYFGDDYVINDMIKIHQPTIGEVVNYNEAQYFSTVHTLTAIPSDLKSQLWDMGLDWCEVEDFELFMMLSQTMTPDRTALLFGNIDFSNNKNVAIFSTMLACGVSGFAITSGSFNLSGIALAMVVGIILNLILKDSKRA